MAYTPYYPSGWQSGEEGGTPITPEALNNMEAGIGAANAIGDPVTVAHGGTGSNVPSGARSNLGIYLNLTSSTASVLYTALNDMSVGETICAVLGRYATPVLIADAIDALLMGTILRVSSTEFRFSMSNQSGLYRYEWSSTYANGAWTRNTGYIYTGTAL